MTVYNMYYTLYFMIFKHLSLVYKHKILRSLFYKTPQNIAQNPSYHCLKFEKLKQFFKKYLTSINLILHTSYVKRLVKDFETPYIFYTVKTVLNYVSYI